DLARPGGVPLDAGELADALRKPKGASPRSKFNRHIRRQQKPVEQPNRLKRQPRVMRVKFLGAEKTRAREHIFRRPVGEGPHPVCPPAAGVDARALALRVRSYHRDWRLSSEPAGF